MNDFLQEFAKIQLNSVEVEYRLYYNESTGEPICYSMEDLNFKYINISKAQYAQGNYNVIIKNNQIVEINDTVPTKLVPGTSGTSTLPNNVMVIADTDYHWELKQCL